MVEKYPNRPCDNNIREWFPNNMEHISAIVRRVMEKLKVVQDEEF